MVRHSHFTCYLEFKGDLDIYLLDGIDQRGKSEWEGGTLPSHTKESSLAVETVKHLWSVLLVIVLMIETLSLLERLSMLSDNVRSIFEILDVRIYMPEKFRVVGAVLNLELLT